MSFRPAAPRVISGLAVRLKVTEERGAPVYLPPPAPPESSTLPETTHGIELDEEDSLFVTDTERDDSASFKPATEARALNPAGHVDNTICNSGVFANHPHHHILSCGHIVETATIQACANNCKKPPVKDQAVLPKTLTRLPDFACPRCYIARRERDSILAMPRARPATRDCTISHVYGYNEKADQVQKLAAEKMKQSKPKKRVREDSPDVQEIGRRLISDTPQFVIKLEEELEPDVFQLQEAYRELRKGGARILSQEELEQMLWEEDQAQTARQLKKLRVDGPEALRLGGRPDRQRRRKIRSDRGRDHLRDHLDPALEEYDRDRNTVYRREGPAVAGSYEDPERHCICDSFDDGYMVTCGNCDRMMHPGCVGLGQVHHTEYASAAPRQLEAYFKSDMEKHIREGKKFTCKKCLVGRQGGNEDFNIERFPFAEKQRKKPVLQHPTSVAVRSLMEKKFEVHPAQAHVAGDTAQSKRERRQMAHEEAGRVTERRMAATPAPSVDRPATRALQRRVGLAVHREA